VTTFGVTGVVRTVGAGVGVGSGSGAVSVSGEVESVEVLLGSDGVVDVDVDVDCAFDPDSVPIPTNVSIAFFDHIVFDEFIAKCYIICSFGYNIMRNIGPELPRI
jgi:hypothetical protein